MRNRSAEGKPSKNIPIRIQTALDIVVHLGFPQQMSTNPQTSVEQGVHLQDDSRAITAPGHAVA